MTDAGLTPYHAVKRSLAKLGADSTAVVVGAGGLGHVGVQILKAMTAAQVAVVDPRESARALAERAGADATFAPGEETVAAVRELAHGRGADVVLDFVGSDETMASGAAMSRMMGDLTIVGIAGGTLPFSFFAAPYEVSIQTTYWGTRQELIEVLDSGCSRPRDARDHHVQPGRGTRGLPQACCRRSRRTSRGRTGLRVRRLIVCRCRSAIEQSR